MTRLALLALALIGCARVDIDEVRHEASDYARNLPGTTNVVCADADSDGDGYVSCTVFRGSGDPIAIQCGAERYCLFNCAHGCKYMPIPRSPGPQ
jgi:hypothetical protein